jgi:hypothetical protein
LLSRAKSPYALANRGHDTRAINDAEARVILQEIKTIVADPTMEHRSIGIIRGISNYTPITGGGFSFARCRTAICSRSTRRTTSSGSTRRENEFEERAGKI